MQINGNHQMPKPLPNKDQHTTLSRTFYDVIESNMALCSGNFLEIGTFNGAGAARVADKFPDRIIYVVDPFIEDGHTGGTKGDILTQQRYNAQANFKGKDNIKLYDMTSLKFKDHHLDEIQDICIVFIDGSHHYDDVTVDFEIARKVLPNGGLALVDDLHISDVVQALNEAIESGDFEEVCAGVLRKIPNVGNK